MINESIDRIVIHTETMIKGFFYDYRWLSNYHVCEIQYEGRTFSSSEAAYQSAKFDDPYIKDLFTKMTPSESKKASHVYKVRRDWDNMKKNIMYEILVDKFTRNTDVREKLLETGDKYLEETNYWNDVFWGVHMGKGKNALGELLMRIRKEIKT